MIRRQYLCICEGLQEKMYIKRVSQLINNPPKIKITINTTIGKAKRLEKEYVEYDSAVIFDHDLNQKEFEENLKICREIQNNYKKKKSRIIYPAFSILNFDLWLVLHKEEFCKPVSKNEAYQKEIIKIYNLPKNADIKKEENIDKILGQIEIEDVKNAIKRANKIKEQKLQEDKKEIHGYEYYPNPYLNIQTFISELLKISTK